MLWEGAVFFSLPTNEQRIASLVPSLNVLILVTVVSELQPSEHASRLRPLGARVIALSFSVMEDFDTWCVVSQD